MTWTWASSRYANGSHVLKVAAWNASLGYGEDTVTVNLANSKADLARKWFTIQLGTEADGTKSREYCNYCYENGAFTANCTMEEMIDFCV